MKRVDNMTPRIAAVLGWSEEDVRSFSFQSLRALVRPINPKLAHEITLWIESGETILERQSNA